MARFNIAKWAKEHRKKKASSRKPPKKVKSKRVIHKTMAKKKGGGRRSSGRFGLGGAKSIIDKGAKGLGYAALAGLVTAAVAPQFTPIARIGAAYYGGGLPGIGLELVAGGGNLLQTITGMFGGGSGGGDAV